MIVLPLQGGRNFRDLGGYRTQDGHHVKWGMLYRSGSMHGLTPVDYAALEARGIRVVCDLRDSRAGRRARRLARGACTAPAVRRLRSRSGRFHAQGRPKAGPPIRPAPP
jgi:protein-tyrosine phosphatase